MGRANERKVILTSGPHSCNPQAATAAAFQRLCYVWFWIHSPKCRWLLPPLRRQECILTLPNLLLSQGDLQQLSDISLSASWFPATLSYWWCLGKALSKPDWETQFETQPSCLRWTNTEAARSVVDCRDS